LPYGGYLFRSPFHALCSLADSKQCSRDSVAVGVYRQFFLSNALATRSGPYRPWNDAIGFGWIC
jgi:hypothetical protein